MVKPRVPGGVLALLAAALGAAGLGPGGLVRGAQDQAVVPQVEKTVVVPADFGWVDTGMDVGPGEEIRFRASGEINLQKGNPGAVCGPAGLDLISAGQPIPDANLGSLIGKVVQLVAARIDEDSGLEIRDEIFVLFPIGAENAVTVTFKGRLYLGVNENVLKDNSGEFTVLVVRPPAPRPLSPPGARP